MKDSRDNLVRIALVVLLYAHKNKPKIQVGLIKKPILILLILANVGCAAKFELNDFFKRIVEDAPNHRVEEYKRLSLDSAIIKYPLYLDIFDNSVSRVMRDSVYTAEFLNYMRRYEIGKEGEPVGRVMGAIFHKWINNKSINVQNTKKELKAVMDEHKALLKKLVMFKS